LIRAIWITFIWAAIMSSENGGAKLDHGSAVVLAVRAA
jgi:hypothetical protein